MLNVSKEKAFGAISSTYEGIEGIKFGKQGAVVEISFESRDAVVVALGKDLQVGEVVVPVTRCFSPRENVVPIAVLGVPFFSKEETYKEIVEVFGAYGKISELKFHCFNNSNIRMDSCSVVLDRTVDGEKGKDIPRTIDLFGKSCDLFWKEAKPFCRYCKDEGHFVQKCPKLDKKVGSKPTEVSASAQKGKSAGPIVAKAVGNVSNGAVTGGSGESVHAPASGSGNVMKVGMVTQSDRCRWGQECLI